jgi:hypothetical protein
MAKLSARGRTVQVELVREYTTVQARTDRQNVMPKAKPHLIALVPLTDGERAHLSDRQIHEHYKASAHVEDVRRAIRWGIVDVMPAELRDAWIALLEEALSGRIKRAETHRRLWALCDRWRQYKNDQGRKPVNAPMFGATPIIEAQDWTRLHNCVRRSA